MRTYQVKTLFSILFIAACALLPLQIFAQTVRAQSGIDPRLVARARQITGDDFTVLTRTPRGARVVARANPSPQVLQAIDDGLTELFNVARRHGYNSHLDYSDYTIFIARADRTRDS